MKPETAKLILGGFKEAGINFVAHMPDTWLFELEQLIMEDRELTSILVPNEASGISICAGAWLGGRKPAMLMDPSGLLVACYALTRLNRAFGIPILLFISYRGDSGDDPWWSQSIGRTLEPALRTLSVPYEIVEDVSKIKSAIINAETSLAVSEEPRAILLGRQASW